MLASERFKRFRMFFFQIPHSYNSDRARKEKPEDFCVKMVNILQIRPYLTLKGPKILPRKSSNVALDSRYPQNSSRRLLKELRLMGALYALLQTVFLRLLSSARVRDLRSVEPLTGNIYWQWLVSNIYCLVR